MSECRSNTSANTGEMPYKTVGRMVKVCTLNPRPLLPVTGEGEQGDEGLVDFSNGYRGLIVPIKKYTILTATGP
jgi:hypothetical protein